MELTHHHQPDTNPIVLAVCILSGLAAGVYGMATDAIEVSHTLAMQPFINSVLYAAVSASTAFFVTKFLGAAWTKLTSPKEKKEETK
jgi:hypothetical protein